MSPSGRLEQLRVLARLRKVLAGRERLDRAGDEARAAWCAARLAELRRHAVARSPLYREAHRNLETAPLDELPTITKADVVERFAELVTDRRLRPEHLRHVIDDPDGPHRALGRYRVAMSSGSSGRPGLFPFDEREWVGLIAGAARARAIAGPVGASRRVRSAKIGSPAPWHLSRQLSTALRDPRKPARDLSAADAVVELAAELQTWQPAVLSGYASVLAGLAEEQLAGRLDIAPLQVFSGGEVLTASARDRVRAAWGREPFDQYLTTEAGFVAMECGAHDGLHVLDDHVVVEVVDRAGAPVEPGVRGGRVLLTVLGSRTMPLIRYELDDAATMTDAPCPCGRRSPRLLHVADQPRALLRLPGAAGAPVDVHPVVVTSVLDAAPVRAWQVVHGPTHLRVLVVQPSSSFSATGIATALRDGLSAAGAAAVPVEVAVVDELRRGASGKASLVISEPGAPSPPAP